MDPSRRALLATPMLLAAPGLSLAQEWPSRPIRILVGFPPGQATDVVARLLAERLSEVPGWQIVVENRPGQGGSLAALATAQAPPDGHTWLLSATAPLATNPNLYANIGYESARDFSAVTLIANLPFVLLVNPGLPAPDLAALVAMARARPGELTFGTPGNGTTAHLITAMFARALGGLEMTQVTYRGAPQALTDLLAGRLTFMFETEVFSLAHIQAGRVRALAVSTARRSGRLPDVPALAEAPGLAGFDAGAWLGMVMPASVPAPIVLRVNQELRRIVQEPRMRERLAGLGAEVWTSTPEEFASFIRSEGVKWGGAVRDNNVRLD
jgi:tripartite-type tricarboxylate transporter receptor subunit TctC